MRSIAWLGMTSAACLLMGCADHPSSDGSVFRTTASTSPTLTLTRTIPLPGVEGPVDSSGIVGRIDHMAYDPETHRLFVAAISNGSLEVVDLDLGERIQSIGGLARPQGVAIYQPTGAALVSSSRDGTVRAFDTHTLAQRASAPVGEDADNVRLDGQGNVYIAFGSTEEGTGGLIELNAETLKLQRTILLPLRPESFALTPDATRIFVNQPGPKNAVGDGAVVAVDGGHGVVTSTWRLRGIARNFPLVYDADRNRVFVASRLPARLTMLDAQSGGVRAQLPCAPDCDDLFLDPVARRIILIGGGNRGDNAGADGGAGVDGAGAAVQIFSIGPSNILQLVASIPTAPHARTGVFVPERHAVYVAVPMRPDAPAEIREFTITN